MRFQANDICFLVAGCILRVIVFSAGNLNGYYIAYIYGHDTINNSSVVDCSIYISRGWVGPADICPQDLSPIIVTAIGSLHQSLGDIGLYLVSAAMQLFVAVSLVKLCSQNKSLIWIIYWLNPIVIIQGVVSIIDSSRHFMLSILVASAVSKDKIIFGSILAILISMNYQYACMIPIFLIVVLSYELKNSLWTSAIVAVVLLLKSPGPPPFGVISSNYFVPSFGFIWYADAQMFKQFRAYFIQFWFAQPFLYSYPIALRLRDSPKLAVSM
jgi:hypothetical protein